MQHTVTHYQVKPSSTSDNLEVKISGTCAMSSWQMILVIARDGTVLRTTIDTPPFFCKNYNKAKFNSCTPLSNQYQKTPCPILAENCGGIMIDTLVYLITSKLLELKALKQSNTVVNKALQILNLKDD